MKYRHLKMPACWPPQKQLIIKKLHQEDRGTKYCSKLIITKWGNRRHTSASKDVLESALTAHNCENKVAHFTAFRNLPIKYIRWVAFGPFGSCLFSMAWLQALSAVYRIRWRNLIWNHNTSNVRNKCPIKNVTTDWFIFFIFSINYWKTF